MSLAKKIISGDRRALARVLTLVENGDAHSKDILAELHPYGGKAHFVGVTGAPGVGKSSLVNFLAQSLRVLGDTVGVLAVDPSSPFGSGAILGDRVRMADLTGDDGIYIRSMASRGAVGGLAYATGAAADVLDAAGFNYVIIETVGVGQSGVEISNHVHTTIVLVASGAGDDVQAIKSGILETADILVVNKADLPGAEHVLADMRSNVVMNPSPAPSDHHAKSKQFDGSDLAWRVPLLSTVARSGDGVDLLIKSLLQHWEYLENSAEIDNRRRTRIRAILESLLRNRLYTRFMEDISRKQFDALLESIVLRDIDPYSAAARLIEEKYQASCLDKA